jgi:hypothetical protein
MTTMRTNRAPAVRSAFTLLEMILAATIAVMLLGALYVAVDLQLRHAADARDVVTQTTLARTLLNRIASDIAPDVGTADPTRYQQQQSKQSGTGGTQTTSGTGATTGATTGQATTPNTGAAASNSANSNTSNPGTSVTPTTSTVNSFTPGTNSTAATASPNGTAVLALQGSSNSLTLYVTRLPPDAGPMGNQIQLPSLSDQRRIVYWLADGGGLARQEIGPVTSDDAQNGNIPSGMPEPGSREMVAKEVRSLQFEYFDGTTWQDSWDGTQTGSDGVTPIGPPLAVAITIGLTQPDSNELKHYRHVVAIPTANGVNAQQQQLPSGSGSSSTGGSSTGSGGQ